MALNKATLAQQLKAIFEGVSPEAGGETDPGKLRLKVANEMADAIETFIKSGTVTVASGITLASTGTATTHTGSTTGTGTGTIS